MQNMYEFLICTAAILPVLTFFAMRDGERHALLADAALQALVLVPVAFFMDGRAKHLMPALQSPFFVPHVGAYVIGYVMLVRAAFGAGRRLVPAGFLLMTVGLVLGAAWGKVCWGHWWQFDPKEMWSLATWFVYAAYFHVKPRLSATGERIFLVAGAAMVGLTLTWINLSRIFTGMHSYA
jgi:ABC-type transport system involved in cytochrome c biogenesis permease subunit